MEHTEGAAAVGPDEDERVLTGGNAGELPGCVGGVVRRLAVHREDDVALLETGVIGRAAGADVLNDRTVHACGA